MEIIPVADARRATKNFGTCLMFDGVDGHLTENLFNTFSNEGTYTITAWQRLLSAPTNTFGSQILLSTNYFYIHTRLIGTDAVLYIRFDQGSAQQIGGIIENPYIFNHIVAVYRFDGGNDVTLKVYINGILADENTYSVGKPTNTRTPYVGTNGSSYLHAKVDEVKVFDRELTASEILKDATNKLDTTDGLITYWKFDENADTTASDSSASSNDATLVNGVTWDSEKVMGERTSITELRRAPRDLGKQLYFEYSDFGGASSSLIPSTEGFGIMFWMNAKRTSGTFMDCEDTGATNGFQLYISGGKLSWQLRENTTTKGFLQNDVGAWEVFKWHHIVLNFTPLNAELWVDGVLNDTSNIASMTTPTNGIALNKTAYAGGWTSMYMDQFLMKNGQAFTQEEILGYYSGGVIPNGLTAKVDFEDDMVDQTGNGNSFTNNKGIFTNYAPDGCGGVRSAI